MIFSKRRGRVTNPPSSSLTRKEASATFCAKASFLVKFYLPTPRKAWEWLSPSEVVGRLKAWGDELDVCLYVSPLARVGEEYYFLPVLDLDCKSSPARACDGAFLLLGEGARRWFYPVLSGKKGVKLVARFLLPPTLHEAFLAWAKRRAKKAGLKALGVELDLGPLQGRLDPAGPPQPVRLWGWRGQNQAAPGEQPPRVAARPVPWETLARIGFEGDRAYREAVSRRPSAREIADWTRRWFASLRPAPAWLLRELEQLKEALEREQALAACAPRVGFPTKAAPGRNFIEVLPEVAAALVERGHRVRVKDNSKLIFPGPCPLCGRRHHAWIGPSGKLYCFSPACEAHQAQGGVLPWLWAERIGLGDFLKNLLKNEELVEKISSFLSLKEAEGVIKDALSAFFEKEESGILAADPGLGKTHRALLAAIDAARAGETVVFAVSDYARAEEIERDFRPRAAGVLFQILRGRWQEGMCQRLPEVQVVEAQGFRPAEILCFDCLHAQTCAFLAQFRRFGRGSAVFVCTHALLPAALRYLRKEGWGDIHVIVDDVDENTFLKKQEVSLHSIKNFVATSSYFKKGRKILEKLEEVANLLLKRARATLRMRDRSSRTGLARAYLSPPQVGPWAQSPRLEALAGEFPLASLAGEVGKFKQKYPSARARLGYFLTLGVGDERALEALRALASREAWLEVTARGAAKICWYEITKIKVSCVLVLSATPEPQALTQIFPALNKGKIWEARVAGLERAIRIHLALSYGKTSYRKGLGRYVPALAEALKRLKAAWGGRRLRVFVMAHKDAKLAAMHAVRAAARRAGLRIEVFANLHHFSSRGSNLAQECDVLVQFGAPILNPIQAWDLAQAWFPGDGAKAAQYAEGLAKREAFQEAHRLRFCRAGWGTKALIFVGRYWPYKVAPEVVISQNGRPRKGTGHSPIKIGKRETTYPVFLPLVRFREKLRESERFLALPLPKAEEEAQESACTLTKEVRGPPPPEGEVTECSLLSF